MPSLTPNFGFYLPLVNDPTDQDLWGGYLNDNISAMDTLIQVALNWTPSTQAANFSVTAPTAESNSTGSANILYLCNATSGAITASLPAAATCAGMKVAFKKTDASANGVIAKGNGSELIDGSNTQTLLTQYNFIVIASDGVGWDVLANTGGATHGVQVFTASGTFTTPNVLPGTQFKVTAVGGGGGGGNFSGGAFASSGGASSFGSLCVANGGAGGQSGTGATGGSGGAGGVVSGAAGSILLAGSYGGGGGAASGSIGIEAGAGGSGYLGMGAGQNVAGAANTGAGGGGAGFSSGNPAGGGGGSGGTSIYYSTSLSGSYTVTIGAGGNGTGSGSSGGSGIVIVEW